MRRLLGGSECERRMRDVASIGGGKYLSALSFEKLVKLVNDLEEVEGSEIGFRYAENDLLELVPDVKMADFS